MKKIILFSLMVLMMFELPHPSTILAQGDRDNIEWRRHKGEREFDISGSVLFKDETSFELSGSFGIYITDYVQLGTEGSIEYEETKETEENESGEEINIKNESIFADLLIFLNGYLPTKESNPIEPYVGVLSGVRFDINEGNNTGFIFGGTLGINLHLTENLFSFLQYRLITDTDLDYEHDINFGLGYQFD